MQLDVETTAVDETKALTVSAYASLLGRAVREVGGAVIEGEVQKPQRTRTGLLYFDITDGDARLSCKVFKSQLKRLKYEPKEGDLVKVKIARPDFWPGAGRLSLVVSDIELAGVGELLRRRAELLKKLQSEGLCDPDRRKPLPAFPRAVGVIAGKGSDGMSDVIRALHDRFSDAHIVTCPALVQGKSAPRDVIDALAMLQQHPKVDVIIIARGGGSVQDLIAFDDERLCRAVFACAKPVVAAIGHTDNVPVCNHVTHAASTPSRSAEMVIPSLAEVRKNLTAAQQAISRIPSQIEESTERVQSLGERLRVAGLLESMQMSVRDLSQKITQTETAFFTTRTEGLARARAILEAIPHRCQAAFAECEQRIGEQRLRLGRVPQRAEEATKGVSDHARLLTDGIRRQLTDHERDYGQAIERLVNEFKRGGLRRLAEEAAARVDGHMRLLTDGIRRQLTDHERDYGRAIERLVGDSKRAALRRLTEESTAGVDEHLRLLADGIKRQLADHERDYGRAIERLVGDSKKAALRRLIEESTAGVNEHCRLLTDGVKRQLVDRERAYGQANERFVADFKRVAVRRFADEGARLTQSGQLTRERIDRRLDHAERNFKHVTALIAARDFSKYGFVLATDEKGKPLPSISGVSVGSHLNLKFRDGQAGVAVREIKENK